MLRLCARRGKAVRTSGPHTFTDDTIVYYTGVVGCTPHPNSVIRASSSSSTVATATEALETLAWECPPWSAYGETCRR